MQLLDERTRALVLDIMERQPDMCLATVRPDGFPQATMVSYAYDDMTLFAGIGLDSQKAHNIRQNGKVSLTITPPYTDWLHIQGLSMACRADIASTPEEMERAATFLLKRFPQLHEVMSGSHALPWAGGLFLRISPHIISVLDYTKGFGHTSTVAVSL